VARIEEFIDQDREAIAKAVARMLAFSPDLLEAFDDAIGLFENIGEAYSRGSTEDGDLRIINECGEKLGAETREELQALLDAPTRDDAARAELISRIRDATGRIASRRVRGILLGLLWRTYLRAATDLFRLRTSSVLGYLRFQVEAAALASIMNQRPRVAVDWQNAGLSNDGRRFFRDHQPEIKEFALRHHLVLEYEQGSAAAQHVRLASVAGGYQQELYEDGERRVHEARILYLEDTPEEPWHLIIQALNVLRAQKKLLVIIRQGFPEVDESSLTRSGLVEFNARLDRLFAHFRQVFPEKAREWEMRNGTL